MMLSVSAECVGCRKCVAVCPAMIITMDEGRPLISEANESKCILCGHCVSVCGPKALDHTLVNIAKQEEVDEAIVTQPTTTKEILRSIRSIRNYSSKLVDRSLVEEVADCARYAPTARNTQGVEFIAIMNRDRIVELANCVIEWMEESIKNKEAWSRPYRGLVAIQKYKGVDMIFRGAPHLLIAVAPKNHPYGEDNARMAAVYARTQASALGLGTCWAGFFEMYAEAKPEELNKYLGIDKDLRIGSALMLGYPKYKYHRLVERKPLQLKFID